MDVLRTLKEKLAELEEVESQCIAQRDELAKHVEIQETIKIQVRDLSCHAVSH